MHIYWKEVLDTINCVFQVQLTAHFKLCLLEIIDNVLEEDPSRLGIARALFQVRKLILWHWKSEELPHGEGMAESHGRHYQIREIHIST